LGKTFAQAGHRVTLYLFHDIIARLLETDTPTPEAIYSHDLVPRDVSIHIFKFPRMRDPRSFRAARHMNQRMMADGIDVLHIIMGPGELWLAILAGIVRNIPVASTIVIPKPNVGEELPSPVIVGAYALLAHSSDVVVVNAAQQVSEVSEMYGIPQERVAYVPLGARASIARFATPDVQEEPETVLFFGRAHPHKGLEYLVRAQPFISDALPNAKIIIAGHGDEIARCRAFMHDPSKFEIREGFIPKEDAASYFSRASVVALPYVSASTSGVLMDAYSLGKPVVASAVGCLPEYVEDGETGLLVPSQDPKALADAIVRILRDDTLRARMRVNAQAYVQRRQREVETLSLDAYARTIAVKRQARTLSTQSSVRTSMPQTTLAGSPPMRMAVVGCGAITEGFYLPALRQQLGDLRNVTLIDINAERAAKLAQQFGAGSSGPDYKAIYGKVDAAIVALPVHLHHPVSVDLLSSGIHVLCEKPLAMNAAQAEAMVAAAEAHKKLLAANYLQRRFASFAQVKYWIDHKTFGEPLEIEYYVGEPFNWPTVSGFYFNGRNAPGVLRDRGAHVMDIICWWLGSKPELVSAEYDSFGGAETMIDVKFKHRSCQGHVMLSWLAKFPCTYRVRFEQATVQGDIYDFQNIYLTDSNGHERVIGLRPKEKVYDDLSHTIITNFLDAIATGAPLIASGQSVLDSVRWTDECLSAAVRFAMPWYDQIMEEEQQHA
jgi:predicted dehydrogenase/glycosyltransferase involved in cell wall biosynthesis